MQFVTLIYLIIITFNYTCLFFHSIFVTVLIFFCLVMGFQLQNYQVVIFYFQSLKKSRQEQIMDFIYQANLYFLTFKFHHLSLLLCIIFPFQKNLLIIIIFVQIICSFLHQNHCYVLQKLFNSIALIIVLILLIIILPVILLTLVILIVPLFI